MAWAQLVLAWHPLATWLVVPTMLLRSRVPVKRQKAPLWLLQLKNVLGRGLNLVRTSAQVNERG